MKTPNAQYHAPAQTVEVAGNSTESIKLSGRNANRYGLNRILIGGADLQNIRVTLKVNNGRNIIFENVVATAINNLFQNRSIRGAIIIERGTEAEFVVENTSGSAQTVNVKILGYDQYQLQAKLDKYAASGVPFPEPHFIYATKSVPGSVSSDRTEISLPDYDIRLYRIGLSTSANNALIHRFKQNNLTLIDETFADQLITEFKNMEIIEPIDLDPRHAFDMLTENVTSSAVTVSLIAETYRV